MFKTIERTLTLLTLLLIASTAGAVWLFVAGMPVWGVMAACVVLWLPGRMRRESKKFNSNIIFLLNALENGDYSFSFAESAASTSRERRDVNSILNVIKEILVKARQQEIENEKFLSLIVAAVPVGIVIVDERNFVRVANDAALRLLGMHVFTHIKQLGMVDKAILETFRNLDPGRSATIRIADEREERLISLGVSRIAVKRGWLRVVTLHNIAGELEEREMESWIKLIRVMTHEIMNSIAPITSLSETMLLAWNETEYQTTPAPSSQEGPAFSSQGGPALSSQGGETPAHEKHERLRHNTVDAFETITSTARGLLSFVESYRRFTGIPKPELRPVAVGPFVEKIANLQRPALQARGIELAMRFDDPGITVAADEGQIGQVLVNLLKNAAEAIEPGRVDGKIEVSLAREGEVVHLDVSNNGTPIPEEVLPHIFVPFFTTKSSGTGIGLSVSRYIMRLHGGNLKHHTDAGRTIFSMIFS